jgi:hypothetical protein
MPGMVNVLHVTIMKKAFSPPQSLSFEREKDWGSGFFAGRFVR